MVTEAQIRKLAMRLPDAFEQPSYGDCPSWRSKKRMFSWIRQAPEALVVWVDSLDAKELLLEHEPALFFTTPHYDGHPILLVRLGPLDPARARASIEESYRLRVGAPTTKPTKPAQPSRPQPRPQHGAPSIARTRSAKPGRKTSRKA